jgi:hypothetical protein
MAAKLQTIGPSARISTCIAASRSAAPIPGCVTCRHALMPYVRYAGTGKQLDVPSPLGMQLVQVWRASHVWLSASYGWHVSSGTQFSRSSSAL